MSLKSQQETTSPVQLTNFIGREKEIAETKQSIAEHRLVTLTGSGGTGKTRLSLQVAADLLDQFPGGSLVRRIGTAHRPGLDSASYSFSGGNATPIR